MIILITAATALGGFIVTVAVGVIVTLVSDEVKGWMAIAPEGLLRLAAAQVPSSLRQAVYTDEWLPELAYILRDAEQRPITRLIIGLRFAFGMLLAARRIVRQLDRRPVGVRGLRRSQLTFRLVHDVMAEELDWRPFLKGKQSAFADGALYVRTEDNGAVYVLDPDDYRRVMGTTQDRTPGTYPRISNRRRLR